MEKYLVAKGVRPDPTRFVEEILDPAELISQVQCPVLLAGSLDDPYVSLAAYEEMFSDIPSSAKQMTFFVGLPHMVQRGLLGRTEWELYTRSFTSFFSAIGPAGHLHIRQRT